MAARKRAESRDFNRRRHIILEKGFSLVHNQKDTSFGKCLLHTNVKERDALDQRHHAIQRMSDITRGHMEQAIRYFVYDTERSLKEPICIVERYPSEEQYCDYVDPTLPRFMRNRLTRQKPVPEFCTISAFQPVKPQKCNVWENNSSSERLARIKFKPAFSPVPVLDVDEFDELKEAWAKRNEGRQLVVTSQKVNNDRKALQLELLKTQQRRQSPGLDADDVKDSVFVTQIRPHTVGTCGLRQRPPSSTDGCGGGGDRFGDWCSSPKRRLRRRRRPRTAAPKVANEYHYGPTEQQLLSHSLTQLKLRSNCQTPESFDILRSVIRRPPLAPASPIKRTTKRSGCGFDVEATPVTSPDA